MERNRKLGPLKEKVKPTETVSEKDLKLDSLVKNQLHFYILTMNNSKKQIKKTIPFTITKKNKILKN